jgi:hypothetical protein
MKRFSSSFFEHQRLPSAELSGFGQLLVVCIAVVGSETATAQTVTPPVSPTSTSVNRSSTASSVTSLDFKSVFERYRPFREEKVGSWREANDTVTRVGGWREYLKEAQRPDPTGATMPDPTSIPAPVSGSKPDPHAGHGAKK